jgi:glucokinase
MKAAIGIDIGGTKMAVTLGVEANSGIEVLHKERFSTEGHFSDVLDQAAGIAGRMLEGRDDVAGVGISCGGPLDSARGVILSPPNLPGWDDVPATEYITKRLGLPSFLCNDADACAIAEWKYGAGRGLRNLIFLTFGTGLGAGLILNGQLYTGSHDMAGECGHIRMAGYGPVGYGKAGSLEGFCSGGGIAQLGVMLAREKIQQGSPPAYCGSVAELDGITAKTIADAADSGDETAAEVYRLSGEMLGRGLAILVDLLNPERIIIGSIFARSRNLLWPHAEKVLKAESLPRSFAACRVVPAALGERLGDCAALSLALYHTKGRQP